MEPRIEPGNDVMTVIAEGNIALTFATRKEWRELPEHSLDELTQYITAMVFKGTESVYFLLMKTNPLNYFTTGRVFRLVRIAMDEDGKQKFYVIDLSCYEADQLQRNNLTLWE